MGAAVRIWWWLLFAVLAAIGNEIVQNVVNRSSGPICMIVFKHDIPLASSLCRWMGRDVIYVPSLPPTMSPGGEILEPIPVSRKDRAAIENFCKPMLITPADKGLVYSLDVRNNLRRCIAVCTHGRIQQRHLADGILQWVDLSSDAVAKVCASPEKMALARADVIDAIYQKFQSIDVSDLPTDLHEQCTVNLQSLLFQITFLKRVLDRINKSQTCARRYPAKQASDVHRVIETLTRKMP